MDGKSAFQSLAEYMYSASNSPYYQQLQYALNYIGSLYPQRISKDTIDKGLESCKSFAHSVITANSSYSERRKEIEKAAFTVYYEALKSGYANLFKYYGLLIE